MTTIMLHMQEVVYVLCIESFKILKECQNESDLVQVLTYFNLYKPFILLQQT